MSNEQLVLAIQQGDQEAIEQLWLQIEKFIAARADDYLQHCPDEHKSLKEDIVQQAYFSMLDAVRRYDSEKGSFLTYFSKCLKKPFREAVLSGRGSRQEKDPLNSCDSLDRVLFESDDGSVLTLADVVVDKQPGEQTEYVIDKGHAAVEDADFNESLSRYVRQLIAENSTKIGADIHNYMLDHDCTFRDAVLHLYGEDIRSNRKIRSKYEYHKHKTEFNIRNKWTTPSAQAERKKLMLDVLSIGRYGLRDTGLRYFRENDMSSVEAAVIRRNG